MAFSQSALGKDETDRSNTLGALKINPVRIDKKPLKPSIDKTIESYRDLHELLKGIEKNGFATDGGIPPAMLNNIRSEVGRRLFDLELEENEKLQFFSDTDGDDQAKLNTKAQKFYRSTAKIYEKMLLENPSYKSNDRVLYQLAHIYDLMGETEKMLSALTKLANKYNKSDFYV
ncbi:MAG: hypothetical protein L3J28_08980, partial [Candidatus Polarisedimenticolaceae bacterium]|nr:hypothetical protein [Candidatus Polarisedimenticolaceae bacterium]